jgi:NADH dehydrogenase
VTGGNGFIGRHVVAHFARLGHSVVALQRSGTGRAPRPGVEVRRFAMPGGLDDDAFAGLDALVHGALVEYTPAHRDADTINARALERILAVTRRNAAHLVFLSTLSAHAGARSHYGRNKLALEAMLDPERDAVLRLGLVLGDGGLFGSMVELVRNASVIPLPDGGRQPIQTLWMGDLVNVIERVVTRRLVGRYEVATSEVYTMRQLHQAVMDALGVKKMLVPVPLGLVKLGAATLEALRVPFPIGVENVLGLESLRAFDNAADMKRLGVTPLGLRDSVAMLARAWPVPP